MDNAQTSASSTHAAARSHSSTPAHSTTATDSTTAQPPHILAWPLINRLIPWLAALCVAITGFIMIAVTPAGHIPDVWAHIYRISGILNDDVFARPVTTNSILHAGEGTVGGCVDRAWLQFSIDHYDGYNPNAVPADFLQQYGNSAAANNTHGKDCIDTPYNNAAVNSPVAYVPQLARAGIVGAGLAVGFVFLGVWMHLTSWLTTTPGVVSYAAMSEKKRQLFVDPLGETGIFSALLAIGYAIVTGQSNLNSRSQTMIILALWAGIAGVLIVLTVASIRRAFHARMGWFLWGMVAIATGAIVLTYLALWLQYTPIHTIGVNGVQFRYFLPLSGFYVLCLCESVAGLTGTHIHEQLHSPILKHPNR